MSQLGAVVLARPVPTPKASLIRYDTYIRRAGFSFATPAPAGASLLLYSSSSSLDRKAIPSSCQGEAINQTSKFGQGQWKDDPQGETPVSGQTERQRRSLKPNNRTEIVQRSQAKGRRGKVESQQTQRKTHK